MALPHHRQLIIGDIPALPPPPHLAFDFNEPVGLIIDIDGSVLFGVGYHGWILVTKDEETFFFGGGP
jgi:hypothetical protein